MCQALSCRQNARKFWSLPGHLRFLQESLRFINPMPEELQKVYLFTG